MTGVLIRNFRRLRALALSRVYKGLFLENGSLRRDGEAVLADLRDYCRAQQGNFSKDALMMARYEGRREVFLRIAGLLELDETTVRQFMEVDDGTGE